MLGHLDLTMHGHAQVKRTPHPPRYTVARIRTYKTACTALDIEDTNLSWNEGYFGPRYRLEVVASNMEDMNIKDGSLEQVCYDFLCSFDAASV